MHGKRSTVVVVGLSLLLAWGLAARAQDAGPATVDEPTAEMQERGPDEGAAPAGAGEEPPPHDDGVAWEGEATGDSAQRPDEAEATAKRSLTQQADRDAETQPPVWFWLGMAGCAAQIILLFVAFLKKRTGVVLRVCGACWLLYWPLVLVLVMLLFAIWLHTPVKDASWRPADVLAPVTAAAFWLADLAIVVGLMRTRPSGSAEQAA